MRRNLAVALALLASGCAAQTAPDDGAVCSAYRDGRSRVEVVAGGTVTGVFGVQSGRASPHEGFLMRLDSSCDLVVRVEANTDFTGTFTLAPGDRVTAKGEYEYYPRGGVIHWTHRDPRNRHEGGFIEVGGQTYE
ncbi:MAG: DUF3465 domain-containing protein [Candidatus Eremiobacteraeota bacterium]|nr:DUF3465 domain-containing protein [Candidatus Eremiobacteraeota bacterium]